MKDKFLVAGIQILCDRPKNEMLKKAEEYIKQAVESYRGIDLIVLPEQFYQMDCYDFSESYGEEAHGMFEEWLCGLAVKFNVNIVGGSYAVKDMENLRIYNRCLVADREGNLAGYYDKIHLFDAFGTKESDIFYSGESLGLVQLDIGTMGLWICYDTRFPEIARKLTALGADFFCVPAAFYSPNADQWDILVKSAAISNVTPVIAVNQFGNLPNGKGLFGRSRIVDARGIITSGISDCEGYFVGEIDKNYTEECRKANPELGNRRRDLYEKWYKL
jgi:nitrilase